MKIYFDLSDWWIGLYIRSLLHLPGADVGDKDRPVKIAILLLCCAALVACSPDTTLSQSIQPVIMPALCYELNGQADHTCTPGLFAHSPDVISDAPKYLHTLCQPVGSVPNPKDRWIAKRRPPTNITNQWKLQVMNAYGFRNVAMGDVEGDHIGSLELDGDPGYMRGPRGLPANFYPQLWNGPTGAHAKDNEERLLHEQVCSGVLSLQRAQEKIITDWVK